MRTANATPHAIRHCMTTVTTAAPLPPISRLTVAIAATQGVYNKVNTRNTTASNVVNRLGSCETSPPSKTVNVDTTLSFAVNPVSSAVAIRQSPNPSGLKIGASSPPSNASRLSSADAATFSLKSNVCKNQMMIVARKIIVNAF